MARGYKGAFGGAKINSTWVWLVVLRALPARARRLAPAALGAQRRPARAALVLGLALVLQPTATSSRRCRSRIPPLVWLLVRCLWIARSDRPSRGASVWPVWVLAAATVFVAGFRVGLNVRASNVIDVGYSGVIGADRIAHGQSPYGHFPVEDNRPKCGPADSEGEVRDRIQTNGRCENANPLGDTYGPVSYLAYLPGYAIFGWSGQWDSLPAVHLTSILFDLIAIIGLALVGRRFGGPRLAAALAFAWVAWPFTQYASSSNTNDVDRARAPHLGLPRADDPARARRRGRALGLDEVRVAAPPAALARLPRRAAGARARAARVRRHHGARLLRALPRAVAVACGACLLRPHRRLPDRPRLTVLALGLGPVPREGTAGPPPRPARPPGGARRRSARTRLGAAPALAAAHGCA